ncbi:hypothetical protein E2C01_010302 [Portunus trituberculatus]|uniref:Uncharacterized protein n=1 Tax=Portunus trituberculatus TaxID=210409 RepID=A0A5B7D845_PORTR|nr:hypothetical protein [Portunus trituberculatus]
MKPQRNSGSIGGCARPVRVAWLCYATTQQRLEARVGAADADSPATRDRPPYQSLHLVHSVISAAAASTSLLTELKRRRG